MHDEEVDVVPTGTAPAADGAPADHGALLAAEHITRRFGGVVALADASLTVHQGEIVGLVGDNGAGKSTFLKVLAGAVQPDGGQLWMEGRGVSFSRPSDALAVGIETVYQDLALVDTMNAVQNVYLGREMLTGSWWGRSINMVSSRAMARRCREVLDQLGVKVPSLKTPVGSMSGGQRQCLAIARTILWGNKIAILDEPTAALGVRESGQVLDLIGRLRDRGTSVIIVSHNMQQLMAVADRVTVMRLGRTVASRVIASTKAEELVGLITGAMPGDAPADDATTTQSPGNQPNTGQ
jgi:ABC-type sugar transport system ATPase subunit